MSSDVKITYNSGTDSAPSMVEIQSDVIFEDASFEYQMNAIPGTFSLRVKDPNRSHHFVTGHEIRLYIDDVPMFGGYIQRVGMTYPFSADNTSSPGTYTKRIWKLEGVDYNILFDNRILRRTTDYLSHVPDNTGYAKTTLDGWALWKMLYSFCDFPPGFGITSNRADAVHIDDIAAVLPSTSDLNFFYMQQGTKIRDQFQERAAWSGAVFYIGADKTVHYHAFENVYKRWGFSDDPNHDAITGTSSDFVEPMATHGFREVSGTEDGTLLVNDALVWGGGAPASDTTVFARYQDRVWDLTSTDKVYAQHGAVVTDSSIDVHGRWQFSETRFNDLKILDAVKARAWSVINGPPGSDAYGQQKGLRFPQWQFEFQWFAHEVPLLGGERDHILAGEIVKIDLATFGLTGNNTKFMPCRTLRVSFPSLDETGGTYVLFNGEFSLQYTDPVALWTSILGRRSPSAMYSIQGITNDSTSVVYGGYGSFYPYELPDGVRTIFSLRLENGTVVAYILNTLVVYINGLAQRRTDDYYERNPATGEFEMVTAPEATDQIIVICRTLGA